MHAYLNMHLSVNLSSNETQLLTVLHDLRVHYDLCPYYDIKDQSFHQFSMFFRANKILQKYFRQYKFIVIILITNYNQ